MGTPDFRSYFLIRIKLARTRWQTEFDKGVFALEKKTVLDENVARVKRLVEDNPGCFLPSKTVFRLLTEDLGLRNLLSVLVSHQFSEANKTQRVNADYGEDFLGSRLLVKDESWFYWDSAEWRQVWVEPTEAREEDDDSFGFTCKPRRVIDHCTTCLGPQRPEHHDRPEKGQNPAERLSPSCEQCTDVQLVKHSPYSPDLNLCDRFLVRKLKHLLREDEFGGHEEATLAVQRAMRRVSEDELFDQLRKLREHCHDVIAVGGDYVY
ncbi:Uncharacterized protein FKW44_017132 [Caligus rogercresseyi]|uniref:Uncharacterized protein n=1 Tax=Caligus rogercresseyi TaxID=217165 RepID=A0A7T8K0Y8_CALRO|nr:Uncharacterized protein FKW44_017132 [Caligus rogercresseyi]